MAAKHRQDTRDADRTWRRRVPALLAAGAVLGTTLTMGIAATQADAASPTDAYLGGLGIYTKACPVTPTNVVYVQPGTTLRFHADPTGLGAPTGFVLASLATTMTNPVAKTPPKYALGAGAKPGYVDVTFGNQGTYGFTWSSTLSAVNLLGITINTTPIAAITGAKASWAAQVVVSTRSQNCKLAPQLPGVQVSPSLPVVGQLPGVSVPGVQLPGVQIPGTTANPTAGSGSGSGTPTTGTTAPTTGTTKPGTSSSPTNPYGYNAPDCTGPCAVMPRGGGNGGNVGGASGVTFGQLGDAAAAGGSSGSASGSGDAAAQALAAGSTANGNADAPLAAGNAFDGAKAGSTTPPLPTTLAIVAAAALVGATGLWFARRRAARA